MKKLLTIATLFIFATTALANIQSENVIEEVIYQNFKLNLQSKNKSNMLTGFSSFEQKLLVDAAWDIAEEGDPTVINALTESNTLHYDLIERLRVGILRIKFKR
jgi:hypothetical protein